MKIGSIDIFCTIVDNFGDIGVVYRLAKELRRYYPFTQIRVFLDNLSTFKLINNRIDDSVSIQKIDDISYIELNGLDEKWEELGSSEIIIEAFGCDIPEKYIEIAKNKSKIWLNLEYLSAENWVIDYHLKSSPIGTKKMRKYFFMQGFLEESGGVVIDKEFIALKDSVKNNRVEYIKKYLSICNITIDSIENSLFIFLFTYESDYNNMISYLTNHSSKTYIFVIGEKAKNSVDFFLRDKKIEINSKGAYKFNQITFLYMPYLNQEEFDKLLCCCDINIVRGEESFVRAIVSGKPFLWHAYLQDEGYQIEKVTSFLNLYKNFFKDKKTFEKYYDLLYNYNCRFENSFVSNKMEGFQLFVEEREELSRNAESFAQYTIERCDLVKKFDEFLEKIEFNS